MCLAFCSFGQNLVHCLRCLAKTGKKRRQSGGKSIETKEGIENMYVVLHLVNNSQATTADFGSRQIFIWSKKGFKSFLVWSEKAQGSFGLPALDRRLRTWNSRKKRKKLKMDIYVTKKPTWPPRPLHFHDFHSLTDPLE